MKLGPVDGQRRRCSSLGRRYDSGIASVQSQSHNRSYPSRLPLIGQTGSPDRVPRYPAGQCLQTISSLSITDIFFYIFHEKV